METTTGCLPENGNKEESRSKKKTSALDKTCCCCFCCICTRRTLVMVLACCVIRACNTVVTSSINSDVTAANYTLEWGEEATRDIRMVYQCFSSLGIIFAALVSLKIGYQLVSIAGCVMIAVSLFIASWLDQNTVGLIGVLVGGVTGLGSSCLLLTSIVPILENIRRCRFVAVAMVNMSEVLAEGIYFAFTDDVSKFVSFTHWRPLFRWNLLVIAVAALASVFLKPRNHVWIQEYYSPFDWAILKRITLYLMVAIVFFDSFGRDALSKSLFDYFAAAYGFSPLSVGGFSYYVGQLFGPVLLFCCTTMPPEGRKELTASLKFMAPFILVAGIWTIVATVTKELALVAVYGAVLGISEAAFETLLQDAIPSTFGTKHVRLVSGLFELGAGLSYLLAQLSTRALQGNAEEEEQLRKLFYIAGIFLLISGILVVICLLVVKKYEPATPDEDTEESNEKKDQTELPLFSRSRSEEKDKKENPANSSEYAVKSGALSNRFKNLFFRRRKSDQDKDDIEENSQEAE